MKRTTKKPPTLPQRTITPEMGQRIFKLMEACAVSEEEGKLTIMPGSRTFGGPPLTNLTSELHLLFRGHHPSANMVCRDVS